MHLVGAVTALAGGIALVQLVRLAVDGTRVALARTRLDLTADPRVARAAHREARRLGVRRPVRAVVSRRDVSPMTLPGLAPTVVVPASMASAPDTLRMTMAHEMVHVRRYDDWAAIAERVVAALFAVHPLVHTIARSVDRDREMACDAEVLYDHTVQRGSYARLLLDFADRSHTLRSVALSERRSMLTDRLDAMRSPIARPSKLRVGTAMVALLVGVSVMVVACSDSVTPEQDAATQTSPSSSNESPELPPGTTPQPDTTAADVYVVVEEPPKLKGGFEALRQEVKYPETARAKGIEGRVFVQFVVDETGVPQDVRVTRGVHPLLDREAVRATRQMRFDPGEQRGRDVKVQMSLPITFRLPR
jgi:TonB family protein